MTDHPTHRLDAYRDNFKWVVFCRVCSREGDELIKPCPGKYEQKTIDTDKEHK